MMVRTRLSRKMRKSRREGLKRKRQATREILKLNQNLQKEREFLT
jgi:hypothetical protein